MADVIVRAAEVGDAGQIGLIHVRSWQATYQGLVPQDYLDGLDPAERAGEWRSTLQRIDRSRAGILVAVSGAEVSGAEVPGAEVVGFAGYGPSRDADADPHRVGVVATIYLLPRVIGQGVGRQLMAATVEGLARLGYVQATLWVLDTNTRARRFYAAAGWAEDGTTRTDDSLGIPLHELRYRRQLRAAP